tara:strand:- start:4930 stop:5559 length:630 start_codon:yes stop_codon:yes gene_type:complete
MKYNYKMKVDDAIMINGGKSKKCYGTIISVKQKFALVKLTKDKKGDAIFGDKPVRVKKDYIVVCEQPPIEMPTNEDLKVVDTLDGQDIFNTIDDMLLKNKKVEVDSSSDHENSNPNEIAEKKKQVNFMINENNVKEPAITMDDAINFRDENMMLKLKMDSMVGFQSLACEEIATLKMEIKELKEQVTDSVRLDKLEKLEKVFKEILTTI